MCSRESVASNLNGIKRGEFDEERARNHVVIEALKLGFRLAVSERDALIRELKRREEGTMRPDLAKDSENSVSASDANHHPRIPPLDAVNAISMSSASPKLNNR